MRILIYDINYTPELTGVGKYTGEMGDWLVQQGHTVVVIAAMPYYPEWSIHPKYKGRYWFTEVIAGVTVHRCPIYVPRKVTSFKRIIHELSFQISSLLYWFFIYFSKPYDVVIAVAPPFQVGLLPIFYAKLRKVPVWLHLQDLQIDVAKELGMLSNKYFLGMLFAVERLILKRATIVSTISKGMVQKIIQKRIIKRDCILFPNWVDEELVKPLHKSESLRAELGLTEQDKVILYSGSLGEKQGLELIIEAAKYFMSNINVKFLIVGSGGGKARLESMVDECQLTNVSFHPLYSLDKLSSLLATPDIHLVLQKRSASDLVLPSKLTNILASGGCALVSAVPGTTLFDIIQTYKMGLLIEPESSVALITGIELALQSDLTPYRQNARRYAQQNLSKEAILRHFETHLISMKSAV